ncbi:MAG: hypothetical protein Q9209_003592 [Squamulea sp. 1 TL-2023]
MANAGGIEAKELDLVGKVELRIALTDSDAKLETILNTYLPPLLLKLASNNVSVRNKVISICQHLNTRIKAPNIRLPVPALLKQYKENKNALIRHFDILYIQDGLPRLSISQRLALLPNLVNGFHENFHDSTRHTSSLFNMFLKLLHSMTFPPRGSADDFTLRDNLGFLDNAEDAQFLASWIGKLILFSPNPSIKRLPGLSTEDCNFLQLYDKKETWQPEVADGLNIVETKVVAAKFLASGAFTDAERFLPALYASSDTNSRLSDIGDDMMKRAVSAVCLEDDAILKQLFGLYLGTRGTDGSLPARVPLQVKLLALLCKSKRATSYTIENIQIVQEGLMPSTQAHATSSVMVAQGLEASKLRTQIFAYTNWLARVSDSADIDLVAPNIVSQLRSYIESQGWPTCHKQTSGPRIEVSSLRSLGYESIGVLARSSAEKLVLDEDLDLLRWLFDSLAADSAGRDVSLSIEQALSSILGAFGGDLSPEIVESLEHLLLHNMQRQPGDDEGPGFKIIRSTRFTAVRYANRCLPFQNTKARWINVLALSSSANERREILDEGRKGLDPYWYRMLNPVKSANAKYEPSERLKYRLPRLEDLLEQFFGKDSVWNSTRSPGLPLPMADAYGIAVVFCCNVLYSECLSHAAPTIDNEWDRRLATLIANDEMSRQSVREYLHATAKEHRQGSAPETLLRVAFKGMVASEGQNAILCSACLLQLCSLSTDRSVGIIVPSIALLHDSIVSNDKTVRQVGSRLFGILGSHKDCSQTELQRMLKDFDVICRGWQEAIGSGYLKIHGAMLARAYYWSRRAFRGQSTTLPHKELSVETDVDMILEVLNKSHDNTLLDAATVCMTELSISGIVSPKSLAPRASLSDALKSLGKSAEKGNESAIKALGSFGMQSDEDTAEDAILRQILDVLFGLHGVREPTVQFSIGEALSYVVVGWESKALVAALDVDTSLPPSPSRSLSLPWVLDRILENCKTTKPALRQASAIWLLAMVQYCGHLPTLQGRLRDCQAAFKGFLTDRESLNQETASRGLSLVYEKGDRELKEDLVRDLVGSFTGSNVNMSGSISTETQLFEPGALPTGDGSINTYKDIMSLAAEVGNPSLVYKFMSLAANNAIWSSRAAFGRFGLSNILNDSSIDGYLAQNPKLYSALFRYRFDPNTNVRGSMNEIWTALVPEPTTTIDQHYDTIMSDLLRNILGKEWRTRQACCAAIADLVQSRPAAKFEKYIGNIWTLTFKVCDDIKDSVRTAAMALVRVLIGILTRGLEAGDSSTKSAGAMLEHVLPFLLSPSGLESPAQDIQSFSLSALLQIIKKSTKTVLRPFVPDLVGRLILLLSSLEPEGIEYIRLRAEQYGVTGQQIDDARLSGVRGSPMLEAIERCLDFLDEVSMQELRRPLENAVITGLGLPSRVGGSRVLVSLATRHNFIFKPHANYFLSLARKQVLDRNATISVSYSAACGHLARLASDEEILKLIEHCRKLYFDSDDERHRVVAGEIVFSLSKYATDRFNALATEILPFVFLAKQDSYELAKIPFQDTWSESVGGSRTVLLYMHEIIQLAIQYLDSPRWSLKHTAAFTIAEAINSTGGEITNSTAKVIWPGVDKALNGKTWKGKEKILQAFIKFVRVDNMVTQDETMRARIQEIILRESKRNNTAYRQHALSCLAEYVELRESIDLAEDVYSIAAPIIKDLLAGSDEMDHDMQSGDLPSKTMYGLHPSEGQVETQSWSRPANRWDREEETLANAQAALLRSINPKTHSNQDLSTHLSRALALTERTLLENGCRNVHNAIYEAQKSLCQKLEKSLSRQDLSEAMVALLIQLVKGLSKSQDQVEQTRIKAAEVAATLAPFSGRSEHVRTALIDWISSARTHERSVLVQQSLDRAQRAISVV